MKIRPGKSLDLLVTLFLLLLGGGLLYGNLVNRDLGAKLGNLLQSPSAGIFLGALLLIAVLLRVFRSEKERKSDFIKFQSEGGSVGISTKAVCDFVERIGKDFSSIRNVDCKLTQKKKGAIDIALTIKVSAGEPLPELSRDLQERVRDDLRDTLGLEEVGEVSIRVKEIVGNSTSKKSTTPPPPPALIEDELDLLDDSSE